MKKEIKDNLITGLFGILIIINLLAVGVSIQSCICTVGDTECVEVCEQRNITNNFLCFMANIVSLFAAGILLWLWSNKK